MSLLSVSVGRVEEVWGRITHEPNRPRKAQREIFPGPNQRVGPVRPRSEPLEGLMDPSWSFTFFGFRRERRRDFGELSKGGFQVLGDLDSDDDRLGQIVDILQRLVTEPEDIEAGFVPGQQLGESELPELMRLDPLVPVLGVVTTDEVLESLVASAAPSPLLLPRRGRCRAPLRRLACWFAEVSSHAARS
jgi:hypothetical protein